MLLKRGQITHDTGYPSVAKYATRLICSMNFTNAGTTKNDFKAESYVALLEKIHSQAWFQSPEPADPPERELWQARVALIDVLVYREKPGSDD